MEQSGYYHHHPPGRLKHSWLLAITPATLLMSLLALLFTGAALLAHRRYAFAQDNCTTPDCTHTNHFWLDTNYPTSIRLTASAVIWVTPVLYNPQCTQTQFPPADKLLYVARLIVTEESFSISPESEQRADVALIAAASEKRVRLGWIVQPLRLGTYTFKIEVQVFLGNCLLAHEAHYYEVTAVTALGVTAEGAEILSVIKYLIGSGIVVVVVSAIYKLLQSRAARKKKTKRQQKRKSRSSGKRRK